MCIIWDLHCRDAVHVTTELHTALHCSPQAPEPTLVMKGKQSRANTSVKFTGQAELLRPAQTNNQADTVQSSPQCI